MIEYVKHKEHSPSQQVENILYDNTSSKRYKNISGMNYNYYKHHIRLVLITTFTMKLMFHGKQLLMFYWGVKGWRHQLAILRKNGP